MHTFPPHGRHPEKPSTRSGPSTYLVSVPRWNLVLLGIADKGLLFVAKTLMELLRFGDAEALHRMWQAYHSGRSFILQTHLERGELYVEQFAERGLQVVLERA